MNYSETLREVWRRFSAAPVGMPVLTATSKAVAPPTTGAWCHVVLLPGESHIREIGAPDPVARRTGLLMANLFTRAGDGTGALLAACDILANELEYSQANGVNFRHSSIRDVGVGADGFYQIQFSIPYWTS